ncbi:PREDICTED: luciferin 4-monooxygenase-like [Nicrophorus vespilloides]|uniref:Luciferin 4-monooxygenase-like n=1 Tax=Nicrophorus vespilloides TaxID=110193 RepID=A0ABM1N857_NICVS|nr:PREDICTED: luciferin 4-monooxygenase-like [Nicrophorus vespilloides]
MSRHLGRFFFDILRKANPKDVAMMNSEMKRKLTYEDMFVGSLRLAKALKNRNVKRGDVVGIVCENRPEYFVPIMACFYQGIIVHPMNAAFTTRELELSYACSKPKLIFTSDKNMSTLENLKNSTDYLREIISFDSWKYSDMVKSGEALDDIDDSAGDPDDPAVVLSSSGTTGLPKGVVLTMNNIINTFISLRYPYLHFTPSTVAIGMLPFCHVFGFLISLGNIEGNSKTVILPKFIPELYCETIQSFNIQSIQVVPSIAIFLAKHPTVDKYDLSCLSDIVSGGAILNPQIQVILENKFDCSVRQVYGMSETCGIMTMSPPGEVCKLGSCGKLIPGVSAKIVDTTTNRRLGANISGEICLKSPIIMKEYLNDAEATRKAFDEEGFFRTGDLGYIDEDGYFFIVDRLKDLIKYKGYQVWSTEIEDLLMSHKDIIEASVIGIPDDKHGELTMAIIVKRVGCDLTENEVIKFVAENLSEIKGLHGGVRFMKEIPKGTTGKIQKKKLREMFQP